MSDESIPMSKLSRVVTTTIEKIFENEFFSKEGHITILSESVRYLQELIKPTTPGAIGFAQAVEKVKDGLKQVAQKIEDHKKVLAALAQDANRNNQAVGQVAEDVLRIQQFMHGLRDEKGEVIEPGVGHVLFDLQSMVLVAMRAATAAGADPKKMLQEHLDLRRIGHLECDGDGFWALVKGAPIDAILKPREPAVKTREPNPPLSEDPPATAASGSEEPSDTETPGEAETVPAD
jgi:hypothetical protein